MLKKPVILTFPIPEKWDHKAEVPKLDDDGEPKLDKNDKPIMEEITTTYEFGGGESINVRSLTDDEKTTLLMNSYDRIVVDGQLFPVHNGTKLKINSFLARVVSGKGFTDYDGEPIREFGQKWKKAYAVEPGYFEFVCECGKYVDMTRDKADEADLKNLQVSPVGAAAKTGSGKTAGAKDVKK